MVATQIWRRLFWTASAISLIVAAVLLLLHTEPVQRAILQRAFLAAKPLEISAESVRFNLFRAQAEIQGLSIRARKDDPPFVTVREAVVGWDYQALNRGLDAISGVRASGVAVDIEIAPAGHLNLPETKEGGSTPKGMPRVIDLDDVSFVYVNGPASVCIPNAKLTMENGEWRLISNQPSTVSVSGFSASLEKMDYRGKLVGLSLNQLTAQGHIDSSRLQIAEVGRVDATTDFEFDGAANRVKFSGLDARAQLGTVRGSGSLSIADGPSSAELTATGQGITAKASLEWPGVDVMKATGKANVLAARKDVQGRAFVDLRADTVRVATPGVTGYGATVQGTASMNRKTYALSGKLTGDYPVMEGVVAFTADLAGTAKAPRAAIEARSNNLQLATIEGVSLFAKADATLEKVHISDTTVQWEGQTAHATGDVLLKGKPPELDLAVTADDLQLARILEGLEIDAAADGQANVSARVTGDATDPSVEATLSAQNLIAYGEKLGELTAKGTYGHSVAVVDEARLIKPQENGTGVLIVKGWVDLDQRTYSADVQSNSLHIESLKIPNAGMIQAALELKGSGRGSLDNPDADAEITVDSASIGKIAASAKVHNRDLSFKADSSKVRLDDLGVPGTTAFSAQGHVPWGDWKRVEATATIPNLDVLVAKHQIKNRGPIEVAIRNWNIIVNRAEAESDTATFSVKGRLPIEQADPTAQVNVEGVVPLTLAERYAPPDLGLRLTGEAKIVGIVKGTVLDPQPAITVTAANADVTAPELKAPLTDVSLRAVVNPHQLILESLDGKIAGGSVHGEGKLPFEKGETTTAILTIEKIDPTAFFLPPDRKVRGLLSLRLDASTPSFELEDIVANAKITELSLTGRTGSAIKQTRETLLELKDGRLSLGQFEVAGTTTKLSAGGTLDLLGEQKLNVKVDGSFPADILTRAATDYGLAGPVQANAIVGGTLKDPRFTGALTLAKGQVFLADPPIAADSVLMSVTFDGPDINIAKLEGNLNGGTFSLRGKFRATSNGISQSDLTFRGRSVFLDYPRGFQTASNLNLTLKNEGRNLVLGGRATILDGGYREGIDLTLLTRAAQRQVSLVSEPIRFLENLRFNIALATRQPIIIDNNLGRLQADADLRLVGTPQRPGLTGRLEVEENGKIYFGGRTFTISSGVIDFTDETRIAPRFNIAADTQVSNYDVTLKLTGDVDDLTTSFTSEPSANEDQIMALLFTGSIENAGKGRAYAQNQLLTLFGTGLTGGISTRLRNTFGLSEFRIDPGLLSADSDPTARLTIGQNITRELKFTYSSNLADSQDQIWIAEYDWRRRFLARYFRQSDQSNRMEFRQKLRFGGGGLAGDFSVQSRRPLQRIDEIEITGTPVLEQKEILKRLKLKHGGKYDFLKTQDRIEKLKKYYASKGYAEVRITQRREVEGEERGRGRRRRELQPQDRDIELPEQKVDLSFEIEAGQPVKFIYEGADLPRGTRNRVTQLWQQGIIDQQRSRTALTEVRRSLQRNGYADAEVKVDIKTTDDTKTVVFEIERGTKYDRPVFHFQGVHRELAEELNIALRKQKLDVEAKGNPDAVSTFLQKYLRQEGYLAATVGKPEAVVTGEHQLTMNVPIDSVQRFKLGKISFEGRKSIAEPTLLNAIVFETGDDYVPEDRYSIGSRVQQAYWNSGYRQAEVDVDEKVNAATGRADLVVKIDEKQKYEISAIDIKGLVETSEAFVRRRLEVKEGDLLSAKKINDSRRNLLDSGAYNLLDFTYPAIGSPTSPSAPQPVELDIKLREPKPFRLDYGITYDTERGVGFITDISTINTLGEARVLGLRTVVDRRRQEYRLYFTQPFLGRKRINTTAQIFAIRDQPVNLGFRTLETGIALQQFVRFGPKFTLTYGYRHAYADLLYDALGTQYSGRSAPLTSTLTRDTRDNVLDASKGSFISNSFEYAPRFFGGNINYYRYYVQGFKYFGLTKPGFMPFEGDKRRSHTVFATGARFGLANTLQDRNYLPVDRFFGGGGTTIRGYAQNSIGPTLPDGTPEGGRATFILNNELRFPLYKWLDGVGFFDAGNVWDSPSQFRLTDLRSGAGFGLRIRNPFMLIRLDYGFKIARRPGESMGAFFFSIGQAF